MYYSAPKREDLKIFNLQASNSIKGTGLVDGTSKKAQRLCRNSTKQSQRKSKWIPFWMRMVQTVHFMTLCWDVGRRKCFVCCLPKPNISSHIISDIASYNICDVALESRWTKPPPKCFSQKLKRLLGHFPRNQQWRLATLLCLERLFGHTELQKVKQNARLSAFQALHQKFFFGRKFHHRTTKVPPRWLLVGCVGPSPQFHRWSPGKSSLTHTWTRMPSLQQPQNWKKTKMNKIKRMKSRKQYETHPHDCPKFLNTMQTIPVDLATSTSSSSLISSVFSCWCKVARDWWWTLFSRSAWPRFTYCLLPPVWKKT